MHIKLFSSIFKYLRVQGTPTRFYFGVKHNPSNQIFYVKLDNNESATLWYKKYDNILDMRAIYVPKKFENRGIARLLTEAAFTYAIINDYYLILTCGYVQNLYMMTKNPDLRARVVGPPKVLKKSWSTNEEEQ